MIDAKSRILLRKPTGNFGGYVWTFPKGRVDAGERPAMAALREVEEETGWRCRILEKLGDYAGSTSVTTFYLMAPVSIVAEPDDETEAVVWALPDRAVDLIQKTMLPSGRERDMSVLRDALSRYDVKRKTKLLQRVAWRFLKFFGLGRPPVESVQVHLPVTLLESARRAVRAPLRPGS